MKIPDGCVMEQREEVKEIPYVEIKYVSPYNIEFVYTAFLTHPDGFLFAESLAQVPEFVVTRTRLPL